jgi:hypothetical protein
MRRPAHGGTSKPGPCRPASGFGRLVGRPGPLSPIGCHPNGGMVRSQPEPVADDSVRGSGDAVLEIPLDPAVS